MSRYYAGIGSRETPEPVLLLMHNIAMRLFNLGWILRSGGAEGADSAFEGGVLTESGKEIWVPWRGFNDNYSPNVPSPGAFEMGEKFHPAWEKLTRGGKALHARNCHQMLGADLKTPSSFVVCWTKDGKATGGTGQALRIANEYNIPVFNLFDKEKALDGIAKFLKSCKDNE